MIIRIEPLGRSFKGVGTYLTHDPNKAKTSERVDWTHTLNLAADHVGEAINEMYWTHRAANDLKREAGLRAGGRSVEKPVKHFSLNWHPSEKVTREEIIGAVQDFMRHMGWSDRQAVLVAHNDRPHKHVHVILNTISPADGRVLDGGYEHNRASAWGKQYEHERFNVLCQQRLKPYEQREPAPTREAWQKMKEAEGAFEQAEEALKVRQPDYIERHDPAAWKGREWEALHGYQKDERTGFFDGGKQAYRAVRNAVFREVRTEFKDQWKVWFQLRREGIDVNLLGAVKEGILERQNAELEKRRDAACKELREGRDKEYSELLKRQREERAELRERQEQGLHSYTVLDRASDEPAPANDNTGARQTERDDLRSTFRKAADEATDRREHEAPDHAQPEEPDEKSVKERHKVRDPIDSVGLMGLGALGAIAEIGERLFDGFFGGTSARKPGPRPGSRQTSNDNLHARSAERSQRTEESIAEEAARLHAFWEERRRNRSRDRD